MYEFSERYQNSDGAFGYYDNFPIDQLNAAGIPLTANVNSGLGNTMFVNASVGLGSLGSIDISNAFGVHGTRFNTDVSFSAEAVASLGGFDVDLARFELSGMGFHLA